MKNKSAWILLLILIAIAILISYGKKGSGVKEKGELVSNTIAEMEI